MGSKSSRVLGFATMFSKRLGAAALVVGLLGAGCAEEVVFESEIPWQENTERPDIGGGMILVTNSGSDTVSWISLETLEVVYTQPVGRLAPEPEGVHHGAASADSTAFFVGISNFVASNASGPHGSHGTGDVPGWMLKYDSYTHELLGSTLVDKNPGDVRVTPDGLKVVQSHFDLKRVTEVSEYNATHDPDKPVEDAWSSIAIVNARTMGEATFVKVCPAAHGIGITKDSKSAYVSCNVTDEIVKVGLGSSPTRQSFKVGAGANDSISSAPTYAPYALTIDKQDKIWVSNTMSRDVRVIDPGAAGAIKLDGAPITLSGAPFFGQFTNDGETFMVPVQGQNQLVYIDRVSRDTETQDLPDACTAPHGVMALPGSDLALVACEGDHTAPGTVAVVNTTTKATDKVITVGVYPDDLIFLKP